MSDPICSVEVAMIRHEDLVRSIALNEHQLLDRFDQLMHRMAEQNTLVTDADVTSDVAAARRASG